MVDWDRAAAVTRGKVSAVFDTISLRLVPMSRGTNVNARATEDFERDPFDFMGFFDLGPSQDAIPRHLPSDPGVRGTMVSYDAVMTALTAAWPSEVRKGDIVTVITGRGDIATGSRWEIMADETDGTPRRAFYLNRRG